MASEADFSDPVVTERAVEVTFRPTGDRLSFARFGTLLSPARPISPPHFGPHKAWEIEWLARNLAQQALLRDGGLTPDDRRRIEERRRIDERRGADAQRPTLVAGAQPPTTAAGAQPPTMAADAQPPTMAADAPMHVRLLRDLAQAITRRELSLDYQPIHDVRTRAIVGQEALLRWAHPVCGAIAPAEFIPLAEGSGEITAIGRWVLDHALAEAATWEQPWRVAVNLSPAQFRQADLVEMIHADLVRHQLPGHRLELELTEGVLIDDTSRALSVLRALKQLGVAIALDDFGTGYSNLTYLRVLPIDRIKIDQSFVQDLGTSPQVDAIVRAIIGIGQALGLEVIAEGVETEAQLEFLRTNGCSQVQGFLLGQPSPGPLRRTGATK
jgi:EAL domain-containing protein (putative c-di-GMP-specific phosphodiesterase class I)